MQRILSLATLGVLGASVYIGVVLALFGREWSALFRRRTATDRGAGGRGEDPDAGEAAPSLMLGEVGVRAVADLGHDRMYELIESNISWLIC